MGNIINMPYHTLYTKDETLNRIQTEFSRVISDLEKRLDKLEKEYGR